MGVGSQGTWVGMRGMWEMGWEGSESGWECGEQGWEWGKQVWEFGEQGASRIEIKKKEIKVYKIQFSFFAEIEKKNEIRIVLIFVLSNQKYKFSLPGSHS